jgi:hypothetical protein
LLVVSQDRQRTTVASTAWMLAVSPMRQLSRQEVPVRLQGLALTATSGDTG